jgi:catechol 2,3-dioxygenase-like lactoylglutathione lyase family enzyme
MKLMTALAFGSAFQCVCYPQILPPNAAGVAMGHVHLNVSDIEAQKKFWVEVFDAKPLAKEGLEGVRVPGMLILFNRKAPAHGNEGPAMDHFGFKVRSRDEMVAAARAGGYKVLREFTGSEGFPNAYLVGPDAIRVEIQQDTTLQVRAVAQRLHYLVPDPAGLRAWYLAKFSMAATKRGPYDSADIPGMNLTFATTKTPPKENTKGSLIDHIGFEVKNLEAFCARLEANGVKLDVTYKNYPAVGVASAYLTDPAGTYIELTEGLDGY